MITRAERRREDRKHKKLFKWLMGLNKEQKQLLSEYCVEATKSDIVAIGQAFERVLRVRIQELFNDEIEAEQYLSDIIDLVEEEGKAIKEFENGSVEYVAKLQQCKNEIINKYEKLKETGIKEKEIWTQLKMDYPKFTMSAIKNVITEHKRDLKKLNPVVTDEIDLEDVVKEIFKDEEINVEIEKENEEDHVHFERKSKLVEVTQVREFIGEFGSYIKNNDGTIKTGELSFRTIEDVNAWESEIETSINKERIEFEKKLEEKKIKAYGKLEEVKELLAFN